MPFSQARIVAQKVIVFGATLSYLIWLISSNACFHCMPFPQALIAAAVMATLVVIAAGLVRPTAVKASLVGSPRCS